MENRLKVKGTCDISIQLSNTIVDKNKFFDLKVNKSDNYREFLRSVFKNVTWLQC